MTPLRQRYIDDLRLKNFSPGTIRVYVHAVAKFARHFGRSPEALSGEEVREYLLDLLDRGIIRSSCVVVRNALRHLFTDTLGRPDCLAAVPRRKRERRLPVVLSREEVQRLFAAVTNVKQKALFMVAYDAGLRLSELLNLRIEDIDSGRMVIRIRQGKGKKDRYARLTPKLLHLLRQYWREYRPQSWLGGRSFFNPHLYSFYLHASASNSIPRASSTMWDSAWRVLSPSRARCCFYALEVWRCCGNYEVLSVHPFWLPPLASPSPTDIRPR